MKKYIRVVINFSLDNYDFVYNTLYLYGISTILEEDNHLEFYTEDKNLAEAISKELHESNLINDNDITISESDETNWHDKWKDSIEPIIVNDRLIIFPSWKSHTLPDKNYLKIQIDPKMSFGTGHNETTQLILELMCEKITSDDKFMLDFGCGSGILSIAAARLGVSKIIAIDTDEDAIDNSKENIYINNVQDCISLYKKDIDEITESGFDIICANISSSVIISKIETIHNKLKDRGKLLISGILNEETETMKGLLNNNNFRILENPFKGEWTAFYCEKQ
jgi:ribosomal protein L11 methyltransferase